MSTVSNVCETGMSEVAREVSPQANTRFSLRKRKRDPSTSSEDIELSASPSPIRRRIGRSNLSVVVPDLRCPRSVCRGWRPPCQDVRERDALAQFARDFDPGEDYHLVTLNDFEIYQPPKNETDDDNNNANAFTYTSLNDLKTRTGTPILLFNGYLQHGDQKLFLKAIPFSILTLDGYGGDLRQFSAAHSACIQSPTAKAMNIFYQLGRPTPSYRRFHTPFLWLVDFTRHFFNFLVEFVDVELQNFRSYFYEWLQSMYAQDRSFQTWSRLCHGRTDFRVDIARHVEFLWKEVTDVDKQLLHHPLWKEVDPGQLGAIPFHKPQETETKTIVTPFVYNCFKLMYFSGWLDCRNSHPSILRIKSQREKELGFLDILEQPWTQQSCLTAAELPVNNDIRKGDVVGVERDIETCWKDDGSTMWYAYVQAISKTRDGRKALRVIWLYRPQETTCANMNYPVKNELFFSDHCNCDDKEFHVTDVKVKLRVNFSPQGLEQMDVIHIRQTYQSGDASFVTFKPTHCQCQCNHRLEDHKIQLRDLKKGSTVLAKLPGERFLQPCAIIYAGRKKVLARRFVRRTELEGISARPNELLYSKRNVSLTWRQIVRECDILLTTTTKARSNEIPAPYCYKGTGDCWLLTGVLLNGQVETLDHWPQDLEKEQDFGTEQDLSDSHSSTPLIGLGLFAGGGNFDRGLEEGGAVHFKYAVELAKAAAHTYLANAPDKANLHLFHGSVNDHLLQALDGTHGDGSIPTIGSIDFISAGSPCQGFSILQLDKLSPGSLCNASLVTTVVSYIDLYRPKYAILENVFGMTSNIGKDKDKEKNENVFSQLICALVGMGYQTQQFNVDAWSHGSPQHRSRLIVAITAPGLQPLKAPYATYAAASETKRYIGETANGLKFGPRADDIPVFPHVSCEEATQDLMPIYDGLVSTNLQHPDHRTTKSFRYRWNRALPNLIPRFPYEMSAKKTLEFSARYPSAANALPGYVIDKLANRRDSVSSFGTAWSRQNPQHVFPTVIASGPTADDNRNGRWLHWSEPRITTLLEARRAQSIPDYEVLLGSLLDQWRIVGNSVARTMAVAFGLSLREAVRNNRRSSTCSPASAIRTHIYSAREVEGSDSESLDPISIDASHISNMPIRPSERPNFQTGSKDGNIINTNSADSDEPIRGMNPGSTYDQSLITKAYNSDVLEHTGSLAKSDQDPTRGTTTIKEVCTMSSISSKAEENIGANTPKAQHGSLFEFNRNVKEQPTNIPPNDNEISHRFAPLQSHSRPQPQLNPSPAPISSSGQSRVVLNDVVKSQVQSNPVVIPRNAASPQDARSPVSYTRGELRVNFDLPEASASRISHIQIDHGTTHAVNQSIHNNVEIYASINITSLNPNDNIVQTSTNHTDNSSQDTLLKSSTDLAHYNVEGENSSKSKPERRSPVVNITSKAIKPSTFFHSTTSDSQHEAAKTQADIEANTDIHEDQDQDQEPNYDLFINFLEDRDPVPTPCQSPTISKDSTMNGLPANHS